MTKIFKCSALLFMICIGCFILKINAYASRVEGTNTYSKDLIILVHGIGGNYANWTDEKYEEIRNIDVNNVDNYGKYDGFKHYLEKSVQDGGLGLKGYVYAYTFSKPAGSAVINARELGDRNHYNTADGMDGKCWLEKAKEDFKSNYKKMHGTDPATSEIPSRYILIVHSMGNYAARGYIYSGQLKSMYGSGFYKNDIDKVVFVDSVLVGSTMAYVPFMTWFAMSSVARDKFDDFLNGKGERKSFLEMAGEAAIFGQDKGLSYIKDQLLGGNVFGPYQAAADLSGGMLLTPVLAESWFGLKVPNVAWEGLYDLVPVSNTVRELNSVHSLDPSIEPVYSIIYGSGMPVFEPYGTALKEGASYLSNLRYGGATNVEKDIFGKFLDLDYQKMTIFHPSFWGLPTAQSKFMSLIEARYGMGFYTNDGDGAVDVQSQRGDGIRILNNAPRREKVFVSDNFERYLNDQFLVEVAATELAIYTLSYFTGLPWQAYWWLRYIPAVSLVSNVMTYQEAINESIDAHMNILKENNLIATALLDTPAVFTLNSLQAQITIEAEEQSTSEEVKPLIFSTTGIVPTGYEVVKVKSAAENRAAEILPIMPVPSTLDDDRKYLTQVLVTNVPKRITGKLNYIVPAKMRQFEYSFNFQAWQPITDVNPESGEFALDGLHFAEGQNLLAVRGINAVGVPNHQLIKIIVNTIPMQASKYLPESNYMTNNIYQPIGIEFNKSTYYEDAAGMINILSFEVDGIDRMADSRITSEIDGAYHPYARVNYAPKEPLQDGQHDIVVKARSDVGVSQAIWSFFVDTQSPVISIESLAPYSPRAPNSKPLNIHYRTSDNLSAFLRNISVKVYAPDQNYVTEITTYDTQAVGDNYIQWDGTSTPGSASKIFVPDGIYTIRIKAFDEAGNSTEESIPVTIDSTPPYIIEADIGPKPVTSLSNNMDLNAKVSENSIVNIKLIKKSTNVASAFTAQATVFDGGRSANAEYSWNYSGELGSNGPADGIYKAEISAQDVAGNVSSVFVLDNIKVDRTPPVISANACLPYVLANSGADPYTTRLNYQISERDDKEENRVAGQGISVTIKLFNENTGELIRTWSDAPSNVGLVNEVLWNGSSSQVGKGAYKFQITAVDTIGNTSIAYSTCVKDGIAPVISFPEKDRTIAGSIAIRGVAPDPDWTNNKPFKQYRVYYAKGRLNGTTLPDLSVWKSECIEVPAINRDNSKGDGIKNVSIRPLQNDSTLAYLYSNGLDNGVYTLLVVAEEDGGESAACTRVIDVKNDAASASMYNSPVVKLGSMPSKINFSIDGKTKLPITFMNSIKRANVSLEIKKAGSGSATEGAIAYYRYMPNIAGNQYTGKPDYQPGKELGYFIWTDADGWHIKWTSDGSSHRFTGSLMAAGNISDIRTQGSGININKGLITWDNSTSGGDNGIDLKFDGSMLIATPKIDDDPANPSFTADKVYIGMTKATIQFLPVMINASAEGTLPETIQWDGKLATGGFADSGKYIVRMLAEGADGTGLSSDESVVEVATELDIMNTEAVNSSFSPAGAPDRVSIYYNLSKDSYLTAYVYQDKGILDILSENPPVAVITSEAFRSGNLNSEKKHVLIWRGNYPDMDSYQFYTSGGFYIRIVATAADGSGFKEARINGIKIQGATKDPTMASLDPIGHEVMYNGISNLIAEGSSEYYFEVKGSGRTFAPRNFSYSLAPYGKQVVKTYPYVPFAALMHRGFKQVDVKMSYDLSGTIREKYLPADSVDYVTRYIGFNEHIGDKVWGFRDDNIVNEMTHIGSFCVLPLRALSERMASEHFDSRDSIMWFWGDQTITIYFYTERETTDNKRFLLDVARIRTSDIGKSVPSEKGIFRVKIRDNNSDRYHFRVDVQAELEAPIKYSRLTNRFVPFFGFVNKNHAETWNFDGADLDITRLGFPGNEFFNDPDAKPYEEFDKLVADASARKGMSTSEFMKMMRDLGAQKNFSGYIGTPECTKGFGNYLSEPITEEFGIPGLEYIIITYPDGGTFEMAGLDITAMTGMVMSYDTNPPSLFAFNFPATENEKQNFISRNDQLLARFRKTPSLWTGINPSSPHELDAGSIHTSAESAIVPGQEIKYVEGKYDYLSEPLGQIYGSRINKYQNSYNIRYSFFDVSDQSIILDLDTTEATANARIRASVAGSNGLKWTTEDDMMLAKSGGRIISDLYTFNKEGFSGSSQPFNIADPYLSKAITDQNINSPNAVNYTFWKSNLLLSTLETYDPVDNKYLVYERWDVAIKDLSGDINTDLVPLEVISDNNSHLKDNFRIKLKLDSTEKQYVEIKGRAAAEYYLMYYDGVSWKLIKYSPTGADGTLGWWNVSRLNGKYTVLLKVGDNVIDTKDVLIGSMVKQDQSARVTSPYKRAEVLFKAGAFTTDQLVTVTPVQMDEIDISNRPLIPTVGPIVEVKPSPYFFQLGTSETEDLRPTLVFRYTKDDLKEMYPKLDVSSAEAVKGLGLNIHQITQNGDLQMISDNKQSYDEGIYAFEGPLDHFSEYALLKGSYNLKAPIIETDRYIVNYTPITITGTCQASSYLDVYVSVSQEADISSVEPISSVYMSSTESGIASFKFNKVPLIAEGDNYIFVTARQQDATTRAHIMVRYDITPPTVEASANLAAFSPNGDGKFDSLVYTVRSSEKGKLFFVIKDPKGDGVLNKEVECDASVEASIEWDGEGCADGDYTYIAFAVDEAGNISNNITGQTVIDRAPPIISNISAGPDPFTPNEDGIKDTTTISFEVNESCYATISMFRGVALFIDHGLTITASRDVHAIGSWVWDGKGGHGELIGGTYSYNIILEDVTGNIATSETRSVFVDRLPFLVQFAYADPSYFSPSNPRNPYTNIKYNLSRDNLNVDIRVHDGAGDIVNIITEGVSQYAGDHLVQWNGEDRYGRKVPNGTYGFKVKAVDPDGGATSEVYSNVMVDNDPPTIVINKLEKGEESAAMLYTIPEIANVKVNVVDQNNIIIETITSESQAPGTHEAVWVFGSQATDSEYRFNVYAEDKALNTDEKASAGFKLPKPIEIYDASAAPAIFNPNSQIINRYSRINYRLASKAKSAQVSVMVLSEAGATIKILIDREEEFSGARSLIWYGDDYASRNVPAGNYIIQIIAFDNMGNSSKSEIPVIVASDSSSVLMVTPEVFSPNGDGVFDTAVFTYTVDYYWQLTGEANIQLDILDSSGNPIYTYSEHQSRGTYTHVWDGRGAYDATFTARLKLVDPAGTIVYSNSIPIRADMRSGSALPSAGFINGSPFTPNADGQSDTVAFSYYLDEPSYVTLEVHSYNSAGVYDNSNIVDILDDNVLTSAGTQTAIWDGSTAGPADPDGNGFANKGEYVFVLKTVDLYGNISPKRGATFWVQDVPLHLIGNEQLPENPSPMVFSPTGLKTYFTFRLEQLISGESQPPEQMAIMGKGMKVQSLYNIGRVTVKAYDKSGALSKTLLNSVVVDNASQGKSVSWEGGGCGEGEYTFIASAEDLSGVPALNIQSGKGYIDFTPPVISSVSLSRDHFSPGTNSTTVNYQLTDNLAAITAVVPNKVKVSVRVYDPGDVHVKTITDSVTFDSGSICADLWDGRRDNGAYVGSATSTDEPDGTYTVKILAVDVAGNTYEVTRNIVIDTCNPTFESISVVPSPFSPGGAKPNSVISAHINDANSVTWEVNIKTGASPLVVTGSGSSISYSWDGSNGLGAYAGDGRYNLSIIAYDAAGNSNEVTRIVTVDTTAPSINVLATPELLSGNMNQVSTFDVQITDSNNRIKWSVSIASTVQSGSTEGNSVHEVFIWDPPHTSGGDGGYDLVVIATDEAGNTRATIESLSVDNTAPTVEFTSPAAGSWQRGTFNINGTIEDSHPGNYLLYYSVGAITSGSGIKRNQMLGAFNASALTRETEVSLIATDEAGNHRTISRKFNIDNEPPAIIHLTCEAGGRKQTKFNPYIDYEIKISFEATDNSFNTGSYPSPLLPALISISSEVYLGSTLIASPIVTKYGTTDIWSVDWDGKNLLGDYVNEGDYLMRVRATDRTGNVSTNEFTVKLEDDQQLTSREGNLYSHHPSLLLNGMSPALRFINGQSWGNRIYKSRTFAYIGGIFGRRETYDYVEWFHGDFEIETSQNVHVYSFGHYDSHGAVYQHIYDLLNNRLLNIDGDHRGGDDINGFDVSNYNGDILMSAGRYHVMLMFHPLNEHLGHTWIEVTYSEQKYNKKISCGDISNLSLWSSSESIIESKTSEASAVNSSRSIEHLVWSSQYYSPSWDRQTFSNKEIIYNKKESGILRYDSYPSGMDRYFYPKEVRLSNAAGDSINPAVATDSMGNKVYVVWEDWRTGKGEIYFISSSSSGETWGTASCIASGSGINYGTPSVAVNGSSIYVAFIKDSSGHKELYYIKGVINADNSITWHSTPIRITRNEFSGCQAYNPSIVTASDGSAYVAWDDRRTGTSEIFFQQIPSNFAPISSSGMTTMSIIDSPLVLLPPVVLASSSTIELISPIAGARVETLRPTFKWYGIQNWQDYKIECSTSSDDASLSGALDYFTTTISDVSSSKPICEFTVSEHSMGLDESTASLPLWYWRVKTINTIEAATSEVGSFIIELPVSLSGVTNWPNPFDPNKEKTKIRYRLGRQADDVKIRIYDITGALVRELDGTCNAEGASVWNKYNDVEWDGRNGRGDLVLNGVYPFEVSVTSGDKTITGRGKAVILK